MKSKRFADANRSRQANEGRHWKPLGLQAFEVVTLESGQEYQVQAILKWDKLESHAAATKSEGAKAVFEDIRNYTTAKPVVLFGRNTAGKSLL